MGVFFHEKFVKLSCPTVTLANTYSPPQHLCPPGIFSLLESLTGTPSGIISHQNNHPLKHFGNNSLLNLLPLGDFGIMSPWNKVPLWNFGIFSLLGYWHILPPSSFSLLVLFPLEDFGIFSLLNIHPLHQFGIFSPFINLAFSPSFWFLEYSPSQHIWNFLPLFFLGIFSPLNLCWHLYPPDISLGNIFPPRDSLCQIPSLDYIFGTFSPLESIFGIFFP